MSQNQLLSLAKAAKLLGVHPTTLRRWADQGDILVMTTPGGHRRFPQSEIERIRGTEGDTSAKEMNALLVERALDFSRSRLSTHENEQWLIKIDIGDRPDLRAMGGNVLDLLRQYLDTEGDTDKYRDEIEATGRAYGHLTSRNGLTLADLLEATSFFRDSTLESAIVDSRMNDENIRRTFRSINSFFNCLLVAASASFSKV